jgi:hypothetical protein
MKASRDEARCPRKFWSVAPDIAGFGAEHNCPMAAGFGLSSPASCAGGRVAGHKSLPMPNGARGPSNGDALITLSGGRTIEFHSIAPARFSRGIVVKTVRLRPPLVETEVKHLSMVVKA